MLRRYLFRCVGSAVLLVILPGCHLLVRHGEPLLDSMPDIEQNDARDVFDSESRPPSPGLEDEDPPPAPGLDDDDLFSASKLNSSGQSLGANSDRDSLGDQHSVMTRSQLWKVRSGLSGNTGINTNTAIAPGAGQTIYRTQLRFLDSHSSPGKVERDINVLVNPHVLAYGVRENLSVFGVIPLVKRNGTIRRPNPAGSFTQLDNLGLGDMRFFAKYRVSENDQPGETTRWSVFSGLEVPSYDKYFSSDSWDPFLGTVWTHQSLSWGLDLDWFWNVNTGGGVFKYDEMRYDAAYTYVLMSGQSLDNTVWQLNSIFEFNGSYFLDGSNLLYAAPGFQLALESMIVEASLQLPVVRDLKNAVEPDFNLVIGMRITW